MSVENREASDSGRQQSQPIERSEPLINRPEMQTMLNDSSTSGKNSTTGKEAEKQEEEKKTNQLTFNTNDLYSQNSSTFRAEKGMAGDLATADGKPEDAHNKHFKTADGKFDPEAKNGHKGLETADGKFNPNEKDETAKTADQKFDASQKQDGIKTADQKVANKADAIYPAEATVKTTEGKVELGDKSHSVKTADGKFDPKNTESGVITADAKVGKSGGSDAKNGSNFHPDQVNRNQQNSSMASDASDARMDRNDSRFDQRFQTIADSLSGEPQPHLKERPERTHTVQKGDTLDKITTQSLGKHATESQRQSFQESVRSINKMEPGQQLEKGQQLKLPATDKEGNFTHKDGQTSRTWNPQNGSVETSTADGTKITNFKDGATSMQSPNGETTITRDGSTTLIKPDKTIISSNKAGEFTTTPEQVHTKRDQNGKLQSVEVPPQRERNESGSDGHGGKIDRNKGDRQEENFALIQSKDGRMEVADKGPDGKERISELRKEESLKEPRKELLEKAERNITNPAELAKFKADMVRFEQRSADSGMSDKQVSDTYKEVGRLFDGGPNAKVGDKDRVKIAEQVMSNAASPTSIDQGRHDTCSVTSLESNIYTRNPAEAAKLVADVTLTGQYTAKDGTTVKAPESAFTPDRESAKDITPDGERSLASQIFQITAVNLHHKADGQGKEYKQVPVAPENADKDNGERLLDKDGKEVARSPKVPDTGMGKLHEMITGEKDKGDTVLSNGVPDYKGDPKFKSPEELGKKLEELKRDGKLPAMIIVHTSNPPYNHGEKGEWHAMNVTDYDAQKGEVKVDNQWGANGDKIKTPMKLDELYRATLEPTAGAKWQNDHDLNKQNQARDRQMEDNIKKDPSNSDRMKQITEMEKSTENGTKIGSKELTEFMQKSGKEWNAQKENGTFDQKDQDQVLHKLGKVFDKMPLAEKMDFLNNMRGPNATPESKAALPENAYNDLFARAITDKGWNQNSVKIQLDHQKANPILSTQRDADERQMFSALKTLPEAQLNEILKKVPLKSKGR